MSRSASINPNQLNGLLTSQTGSTRQCHGEYSLDILGVQEEEIVADETIVGTIQEEEEDHVRVSIGEAAEDTNIQKEVQEQSDDEEELIGSEDSIPGFGIGSALAGISGAAYLLKKRLTETTEEENNR